MAQATDGLAGKLYAAYTNRPGAWERESRHCQAHWENIAQLARTETMRAMADNFQALLNMSQGDPESEPYRAGIVFMIDMLRKAADRPMPAVRSGAAPS